MRTLVRLGLPCIAVLLLAGCGVRFFYTQLDWLIPWHLRDYVSLDAGQRSALDRRLHGVEGPGDARVEALGRRPAQMPRPVDLVEVDVGVAALDRSERLHGLAHGVRE